MTLRWLLIRFTARVGLYLWLDTLLLIYLLPFFPFPFAVKHMTSSRSFIVASIYLHVIQTKHSALRQRDCLMCVYSCSNTRCAVQPAPRDIRKSVNNFLHHSRTSSSNRITRIVGMHVASEICRRFAILEFAIETLRRMTRKRTVTERQTDGRQAAADKNRTACHQLSINTDFRS